jgi:hypothetical protein
MLPASDTKLNSPRVIHNQKPGASATNDLSSKIVNALFDLPPLSRTT